MYIRIILILVACLGLSGCNPNFIYESPNPKTGLFPVAQDASHPQVLIYKKVNLNNYKKLMVIGLRDAVLADPSTEETFWTRSVQGLNYFDSVVSTDGLPQFMKNSIQRYQGPEVAGDPNSLRDIEKKYGKLLVLELSTFYGDNNAEFVMTVKDPLSRQVFLKVNVKQNSAYSLKDSYNPALNVLSKWIQENR